MILCGRLRGRSGMYLGAIPSKGSVRQGAASKLVIVKHVLSGKQWHSHTCSLMLTRLELVVCGFV